MRELTKILLFAGASLVLACALAPPLYWAGHALGEAGVFPALARFGLPRYFNRAVLVAAVLLLWPLLASLGLRRWSDLGLAPNPARWRHLGFGFAAASLGLFLVGAIMVAVDRAAWRPSPRWDLLPGALLSAVVVAFIEESFFRGALLGALRRSLGERAGLAVLSLVFAAVHFLKPPAKLHVPEVGWTSGFAIVRELFWQWGEPALILGGFVTLLAVGLVLGYVVLRTRSLYGAVGLHAGWVFALKAFAAVARRQGDAGLWFGRDLLTGLAPVLLVVATGLLAVRVLRPRRPDAGGVVEAEGGA